MAKTTISGNNGVRYITVEGEVDISNLQEMKKGLEQLWDTEKIDFNIAIDLTKATYIDSAVLELIVKTRHKLSSQGKTLTVTTLQRTQPDRVLKTCQFDAILDFRSLEIAPEEPAKDPVAS